MRPGRPSACDRHCLLFRINTGKNLFGQEELRAEMMQLDWMFEFSMLI